MTTKLTHFDKFGRLPGKPSELLRLGLRALERVETDGNYRIDMQVWHKPQKRSLSETLAAVFGKKSTGAKCSVCLAGSTLAKLLAAPVNKEVTLNSLPDDETPALLALDFFRRGQVLMAFSALELLGSAQTRQWLVETFPGNEKNLVPRGTLWIPDYDQDNPEEFYLALYGLADTLEDNGF